MEWDKAKGELRTREKTHSAQWMAARAERGRMGRVVERVREGRDVDVVSFLGLFFLSQLAGPSSNLESATSTVHCNAMYINALA